MERFSPKTIEQLKYYVYILQDPRDKKIFYIGKGKGNRVFAHINGAIDNPEVSDKISLIKDIIENGNKVKHFIIKHGLSEETAFEIESTLIDLLTFGEYEHLSKITNIIAGHHSWDRGIKTVDELELLFCAEKLDESIVYHNLLLININKTYNSGISPYEATRKSWKLSFNKVKDIDYVCGEYKGIIRAIFKPISWHYTEDKKRLYFEGTEVLDININNLYLNKAYQGKKKGQANPIKYLKKQSLSDDLN
jgi:hypothetical protein